MMAVHVRHARLVLAYVGATLLVACWALSSSSPKSLSITHPAAETDVQRAAKFVLLNAVLGISAASILFCSVGFSIAGAIVFAQRERKETDRLHHSDSLPAEALLARQRRETAAHTLTAANVAVAALWLGFAYALDGLRWALPPLPAWVTTCAAVLCAVNVATGAVLAAKHSRWAPWLLPFHNPVPLNEPSRLTSLFEQLRAKCFGRRPGLPKAQKCSGGRRMRRCRSWDAQHALGSPPVDFGSPSPFPPSPLPIASPLQPSMLPSNATPADHRMVLSPALTLTPTPGTLLSPPAGAARSMCAGFTAEGARCELAHAVELPASSFQTPRRGIQRTYSEDEEVDLSAASVLSASSIGSADSDGSREFMDVLQANILSHPDDTLEFLQRLSPERTPPPAPKPSFAEALARAVAPLAAASPLQPLKHHQQQQPQQQEKQADAQQQADPSPPATPPQQPVPARRTSLVPPPGLAPLQLPCAPECSGAAAQPLPAPVSGAAFATRKQAMTRVSATVDELLNAIVGDLV